MLESRLIGETCYYIHDDLDEFLFEAVSHRIERMFSYVEDGSGEYELIAGFVEHSKSAYLYLAPEPLDQSRFGQQQLQFQRYLSQQGIESVRGRIEVAARGEILQFFDEEQEWQRVHEQQQDSPVCFVAYKGGTYLASLHREIYSLMEWNQTLTPGTSLRELQPYSDLEL